MVQLDLSTYEVQQFWLVFVQVLYFWVIGGDKGVFGLVSSRRKFRFKVVSLMVGGVRLGELLPAGSIFYSFNLFGLASDMEYLGWFRSVLVGWAGVGTLFWSDV